MTLKINHLIQQIMVKKRVFQLFFALICLFALLKSLPVYAIEVTDLYRSVVPVESQSSAHRKKATRDAMEAVLLKVGGDRQVLAHPAFKDALKKVSAYLTQYQYVRRQEQLYFQADFDEQKINTLFQRAQLAIWGSHRPLLMLWIIEEQGIDREIYHDDEQSVKTVQIKDHAQLRGLPIMLPLMDLEDSMAISNSEVWGRFAEPVLTASKRYLAEASVVMRISNNTLRPKLTNADEAADEEQDAVFTRPFRDYINPENNQVLDCQPLCVAHNYVLDWTLISPDRHIEKQYSGNVKSLLITQALNDITEKIYQNYAFNLALDDSELVIDVANVTSMAIYLQLNQFFNSLSSVDSVHLDSVHGDNMRFKLALLGNRQSVLQALNLDNRLTDITDPLAPITEASVPVFEWNQP